ncbi:MAG: M3 family oligoendopeptidase [Anaerolineales bacterium]|nr:M3 family oligoendopeptidase [Anaerolineales bacterium]
MSYKQTKWSLDDLYPGIDSPKLETTFDQIEEQITAFEGIRNKLQADIPAEQFMDFVRASETTARLESRLYAYAGLSFSADTQDQPVQTLMARIEQFLADVANRTLFFSLWWKELDDQNAERLMAEAGDYRYYLQEIRNFKPHTLSEPEEKIINLKNVTGFSALNTLYDAITNRYIFKLEEEGKVKELTRGELMTYVQGTDPDLRARAYQELYRVYGEDGNILGQMYQTLVRDWRNENLSLRKFASPISVRNLRNDIPDEAVETLLRVSQKNGGIFQRFFKLKARTLGKERLRRYDIYAPVIEADKEYSHEQAAEMVLASFKDFDPRTAELAQRVFDENHLDSEVRKGKRSGAFCWSILPEMTPFVLLNHTGKARDVATMAHELGHAIHSMLASEHTAFTFHSSLPLAETASTFGEMMLVDKMLAEEKDQDVRRDLLFRQVDDAYATIMRQTYFALFEKQAHEMIHQNASVEALSKAYMENLEEQFDGSLELSDEFKWEWVSIPHIYHTPFYVYAYAFGQLLVLSLYRQYKAEGDSFKPKYLKILAAGGSQAPADILSEAGIDIRSADFWQGGFDVIKGLVDQLETL